ncbi:TupA-like ATPgrasp [Devosia enhydra]|uniref:TupA-like ATPgrasp n=1 Tax=Devosia enhydra TaxID=665118 RepID=A0A1K2I2N4_9HYPH|nr:ATP-grasp fold amidoligase family protein [Devosia enhydra]SFZ86483.1 TupA-like ATPgrasp [Devosia enhydra]
MKQVRRLLRRTVMRSISDGLHDLIMLNYVRLTNGKLPHWPNLSNPTRLSDKMLALKRFHRHPLAVQLADKLLVRDIVAQRLGPEYAMPLLQVADSPEAIDRESLPERFVVKPNHGSGMVMRASRDSIDWVEASRTFQTWLDTDYAGYSREYQYATPRRVLLVQPDLKAMHGEDLPEPKVLCFNGEPRYLFMRQVEPNGERRRNVYDAEGRLQPFSEGAPHAEKPEPAPERLKAFFAVARAMAADLPFARVDLYDTPGQILLGEVTFHHNGGFLNVIPDRADAFLGSQLVLPPLQRQGRRAK